MHVKSRMWNGMECGMDYGMHLVYHKHANYVATPINYPLLAQGVEKQLCFDNDYYMIVQGLA